MEDNNQVFKTKVSMNSSEEINFQSYIDSVKLWKTPWKIFENFMKDLTYSNIDKLSQLNTILLAELTMNFSDLEKSKFLNSMLLTELKYSIESKAKFEIIENEIPITTTVEQDFNIVTTEKESEHSKISIIDMIENDSKSDKISKKSNDYYEEINSTTSILHEEKQITNKSQEQHANIAIVDEEKFFSKEKVVPTTELDHFSNKVEHIVCDICHKMITDSKEMKMDMKKIHHMGKDVTLVICHNCNKEIMSKLFNCGLCGKSFSHKGGLKKHIKRHTPKKQ